MNKNEKIERFEIILEALTLETRRKFCDYLENDEDISLITEFRGRVDAYEMILDIFKLYLK